MRTGLNPEGIVTSRMLGKAPESALDGEPWETQEELVMGLWAEIDQLNEDTDEN